MKFFKFDELCFKFDEIYSISMNFFQKSMNIFEINVLLQQTARRAIPKHARRDFDTIVILIHWRVWKERNARIFQQTACDVDRVLDLIREDIGVWRAAGCVSELGS